MIEVACVCGNRIKVQDEHAGLSIKCPKCRKLVAVAAPAGDSAPDTIPPPGLPAAAVAAAAAAAGDADTVPPPGFTADEVAAAMQARADTPAADMLLPALERLTDVCRGIRLLLAAILGVLALQWLSSLFRK